MNVSCVRQRLWNIYPIPNSSQLAFPTTDAPAWFSNCTTVASNGDVKSRSIRDEHVVGIDFVHMLSFIAIFKLDNGPVSFEFPSTVSIVRSSSLDNIQ